MNFQGLKNVETADWYLDLAFSKAKKDADDLRSSMKGGKLDRIDKSKKIELEKLKSIRNALTKQFMLILKSFPSIDNLPEFYNEMIRVTLDYEVLKKSLGSINWAVDKINIFTKDYQNKIKKCSDPTKINDFRRQYYGRISSIIAQVKKSLIYLEEARKIMRAYPSVKSNMFTVCIAGFPNVGKSTLLNKLTGAKSEINSYAFTTKRLNLGYVKTERGKAQFIDTPGTLNRFNKMNPIEQQAHLAVRYCADLIIYVYDLTEEYSVADQKKLMMNLKKFDKPIVIYLSKTDIIEKGKVDDFISKSNFKDVYTDMDELVEKVEKLEQKWNSEKNDF